MKLFVFQFLLLKIYFTKAYFIGEPCKYDEDCLPEHSYCEMQQLCECKENFLVSSDGEKCIALIGAYCHSKYDCSSLPNSICKDDRCACDKDFVSDKNNAKCVPVAKYIKAQCETPEQCQKTLGEDSFCNSKKECVCRPNYHYNGKCILSKHLDETCRKDDDCFIGEEYRNTVFCSNGKCSCKAGYHFDQNICISSGSKTLPMLFQVLITFFICYISKRMG